MYLYGEQNLMKLKKSAVLLAASLAAVNSHAETDIEQVTVVGQRAMLENSIARQKDDDLIKSILTRDAIGQFPDQNVAESVRRLAGVNVLNDQGEGRFIAVRGLDPSLNSASINGARIPAPESDTRQVALDVIASELIESLEVIKTLTPDMDADTIGAAIRINTTSAFEVQEPHLNVKIENSYNDLNEEHSPKAAFDFAYPISERLGISGGASYYDRDTSTDNIEAEGWAISDTGVLYASDVEYRDYDVNRKRVGYNLSVDYRVNDNTVVYGRALYSIFDDFEERRRLVFAFDEAPSSGTESSAVFLSDDGEIEIDRGLKDRFEGQTITSVQFGGETELEKWTLEYEASFSRAEEEETNSQDPTRFSASFENPGELAVAMQYGDIERIPFTITAGNAAFTNPATYEFNKYEQVEGRAEDDEVAFRLDITRKFQLDNGDLDVKFGGKFRERTKQFYLTLDVFDEFNGTYTLADAIGSGSYDLINIDPLPNLSLVRGFNARNAALFTRNVFDSEVESALEDFVVDEDVLAVYLMGRYESGPLTVIGGLRLEQTNNDFSANLVEIFEDGGTRNGIAVAENSIFVIQNNFDQDYRDYMPSISVRYEATDELILRGGIFKSLVRPNFAQLAPRFAVEEADDGEREGEFGNPDLDPYTAWNYDLSAEYYMSNDAVIQVGLFHKQIDNFIVGVEYDAGDAPFNGVFNGVAFDEAVIPLNGDEAEVTGLEFNYQQALTFLPEPFDGMLVGLNYTYTDNEGEIIGRNIPLPAASEHNYNATLGYEKHGFSIRLTAAYRDEYLDELSGDAEEDRYVEDHLQIDLTASYAINENIRVFGQLINLNDEPYVAFQEGPGRDRLLQYEEYSWTGTIGVRASF
jgi:TonB-dependent receptor